MDESDLLKMIRLPFLDMSAAVDSPYTPAVSTAKGSNLKQAPSDQYFRPGFS